VISLAGLNQPRLMGIGSEKIKYTMNMRIEKRIEALTALLEN